MKTCSAVRHVPFEDLGSLEGVLAARGFAIRYVDAPEGGLQGIDPLADDLVIVLGGPISAYEEGAYPFLADELRLIGRRLNAESATLGICLGAQIMARALGARVYPNPAGKEIGWSSLELTHEGTASCLDLLDGAEVLHWHGDTFDLPHGALRLASTPITPNQAFSWGMRALALQFHIEATAAGLETWYVGHAAELTAAGLSVPELRADSSVHAPRSQQRASEIFSRWIDEVCG